MSNTGDDLRLYDGELWAVRFDRVGPFGVFPHTCYFTRRDKAEALVARVHAAGRRAVLLRTRARWRPADPQTLQRPRPDDPRPATTDQQGEHHS